MRERSFNIFSYVLLAFLYSGHAQVCISDSGQTVPFTLSEGATSEIGQLRGGTE